MKGLEQEWSNIELWLLLNFCQNVWTILNNCDADLGESVGSHTFDIFQFSIWLKSSWREVHFAKNSTWIGPVESYSNWKILETIENKRNALLFLAVSHNQCSQLSTDPAISKHNGSFWKYLHHIPFSLGSILDIWHPFVIS